MKSQEICLTKKFSRVFRYDQIVFKACGKTMFLPIDENHLMKFPLKSLWNPSFTFQKMVLSSALPKARGVKAFYWATSRSLSENSASYSLQAFSRPASDNLLISTIPQHTPFKRIIKSRNDCSTDWPYLVRYDVRFSKDLLEKSLTFSCIENRMKFHYTK